MPKNDAIPLQPDNGRPRRAYAKVSREQVEEESRRREEEEEEREAREQIKRDWEESQKNQFFLFRFFRFTSRKIEQFFDSFSEFMSSLFSGVGVAIELLLWLNVLFVSVAGGILLVVALGKASSSAFQETSMSTAQMAITIDSVVAAAGFSTLRRLIFAKAKK